MLEKYQDTQVYAYKIMNNVINKNEHSHAYIIETNGYLDGMGVAIAFAKALFCVNVENTQKICDMIDNNDFPELKIIDPEGLIIKKEEIDELQYDFSKKPIYSDKKIYIINNAERLNKSAANSILKFLEEPEQDIVAILVTENIYNMLSTIISRCQIISLIGINKIENPSFEDRMLSNLNMTKQALENIFGTDTDITVLNKCIDFVNYYEKYKLDVYIHLNELWFNVYKEKEQFYIAFSVMILYYIDILRKKCHTKVNVFEEDNQDIINLSNKLSYENLCTKINLLLNLQQKIKENNNLNLIMDKLIIEFGRCDGNA